MGTAANVLVGAEGIVYYAPLGTTLPTTGDEELDDAFVDQGYINVEGVTESHAQTTKKIAKWGGQNVRTLLTEQTDSLKATFLETNEESLQNYHGPQDDPSVVVVIKAQQGRRGCWVVDAFDGDNVIRYVVPDGQVTATEDVQYTADEAVQYPCTVDCYPDAENNTAYKYPPVAVS